MGTLGLSWRQDRTLAVDPDTRGKDLELIKLVFGSLREFIAVI
jgi:hypothetical protein